MGGHLFAHHIFQSNVNRHITAFLLAPLTVPLFMSALALQILREVPYLYWFGLLIAAAASYSGAILVGAPAYVTLRLRGLTAFWLAPLIGSMAGVIMALALAAIFPLALESGILTAVVQVFANGAHWGEVIIVKPNSMEALVGPAIIGMLNPGSMGPWSGRRANRLPPQKIPISL